MYGSSLIGWRMIVFYNVPISIFSLEPPTRSPVSHVIVPLILR